MYINHSKAVPGEKFVINIHRFEESQLDRAIEDLEKRGFHLVKKVLVKDDEQRVCKALAKLEKMN